MNRKLILCLILNSYLLGGTALLVPTTTRCLRNNWDAIF